MPPRISLICVVLNVAKYIEETIKNIQAQTYDGWELLVIDGASVDGTQAIVEKYTKKDPRIKLFSEPDEGPWDATDKGVARAEGEFLMVVGGQDGFLDNEWFAKCLKIFDADKSVSLVWASTRGMSEDGKLLPEEHITYSYLMKPERRAKTALVIAQKMYKVIRDLIFLDPARRKILLKKVFSKTSIFRFNFYTRRSFPGGVPPQKEDWFKYWLDTGTPFSDQPICMSKKVYLDCVPQYRRGSGNLNDHRPALFYNFNSKGYLAYYVPILAGFGRTHPGNSGDRIPRVLYDSDDKYLQKLLDLRKRFLVNHEEMVFVDRDGNEVSRRKF
ncbi:MAG: hypothetical protein A2945_00475 [Candidatus Liptonbacteria bacterium RIFCSPLOWO2_01_FULL_52_25]|uniref:Glycosyltransferase 2-like domain-containing protein n=1 Tax=Candidatus Liptonbacteria bacterium RIFCSPLOWO2_01_FULL_52_25 TaxID=1798650 RepID=A0A1G2CFI2_9BACT|nr:MAG: hypothetical protein A2945_00475 [Candidatus Liptonbacteria bacterium RIFCSPLOWO2_01_FULL_52_25]